ncbi:outer membrane protein assembly factor BamD [Alphaproteobacteria bacterium]|nr:outer membrane protein assembly factor BamD [Alphaproteobacteria bacterium]
MNIYVLIFAVFLVAGCSREIDLKLLENKSATEILEIGKKEMKAKKYADSVLVFEELERLHPYSKVTADAQILAGECNYKAKKYDEAISAFELFIRTHPTHWNVPYALYMLGLINYELMPIIERDQDATIRSFAFLNELCRRYPQSKYCKFAKILIKDLREQIAGREVYVARYYQLHKNYPAAANRLNTIVDNYRNTEHAPEALHRLIECYMAIGVQKEALRVNKILQREFPKSIWAMYARKLMRIH